MVKDIKLAQLSSVIALALLSGYGGYDNENKNIVVVRVKA